MTHEQSNNDQGGPTVASRHSLGPDAVACGMVTPRVRQKMKRLRAMAFFCSWSRAWGLRGPEPSSFPAPAPQLEPEEIMVWTRWYVVNPIGPLDGMQYCVRVVGAHDGEFSSRVGVPRGRVIETSSAAAAAIEKWTRNKCIELFAPEKHGDAILESPPEQPPVFPAWFREEEPGRSVEREMEELERARRW